MRAYPVRHGPIRRMLNHRYVLHMPMSPGASADVVGDDTTGHTRGTDSADSADGLLYKIRRHYPGLVDRSGVTSEQ